MSSKRSAKKRAYPFPTSSGPIATCMYHEQDEQGCTSCKDTVECHCRYWVKCLPVVITPLSSVLCVAPQKTPTTIDWFKPCLRAFTSKRVTGFGAAKAESPDHYRVITETPSYKTARYRVRVYEHEHKKLWHLLLVYRSGHIFVQYMDRWVDAVDTHLTDYDQRHIRFTLWGSTMQNNRYDKLEDIPTMKPGQLFWIINDPDNNGLWKALQSGSKGARARRMLPDYYSSLVDAVNRIHSSPWTPETHECEACFGRTETTGSDVDDAAGGSSD